MLRENWNCAENVRESMRNLFQKVNWMKNGCEMEQGMQQQQQQHNKSFQRKWGVENKVL